MVHSLAGIRDICNRNRQVLVYYLHECVRRERQTRSRRARGGGAFRKPARGRALTAVGVAARCARARGSRGAAHGHPEMRDADGAIYLYAHSATHVTPPPPLTSNRATLGAHTPHYSPHSTTTRSTRDGHDYVRVHTAMPKGSSQSSSKCAHASRPLSTDTAAPARHGRAAC